MSHHIDNYYYIYYDTLDGKGMTGNPGPITPSPKAEEAKKRNRYTDRVRFFNWLGVLIFSLGRPVGPWQTHSQPAAQGSWSHRGPGTHLISVTYAG